MPSENIDLFADDATAPAGQPVSTAQLEQLLADAGRKGALKAMTPEQKDALARAVSLVAQAKRAAYERAVAGEKPGGEGWLAREPVLADAVAKLNAAFLEWSTIPMAQG